MTNERLLTPEELEIYGENKHSRSHSTSMVVAERVAKAQLAKADKHRLDRPDMSWILAEIYGKGKAGASINYRDYSRQILALIPKPLDRPDREKIRGAIEKVFASVAKLDPKTHKNVLGDKWKYIDAVVEYVALIPDEEEIRKQERERIIKMIEKDHILVGSDNWQALEQSPEGG